jgi:hypothetical protein
MVRYFALLFWDLEHYGKKQKNEKFSQKFFRKIKNGHFKNVQNRFSKKSFVQILLTEKKGCNILTFFIIEYGVNICISYFSHFLFFREKVKGRYL